MRVITIGLTGGIGSGKSTVGTMLVQRGAVLVDADVLARLAVEPGTIGLEKVVERFGASVLRDDGTLDRPRLAAVVFEEAAALSDLNAIVHPEVGRLIAEEVARHEGTDDVVVLDIPLLVEGGGRDRYGLKGVLVVDAPVELAVERLESERDMPRQEALRRIEAQASRDERIRAADFVILNTGTLGELSEMVDRAWTWMRGLQGASAQA